MEYPKLPVEFKAKWLIALRSGEYLQAKERLYNGEGYCCLGVAGRVCGIPDAAMFDKGTFSVLWNMVGIAREYKIPEEIIGAANYERDVKLLVSELVKMNDRGMTFNQIADWIEENL